MDINQNWKFEEYTEDSTKHDSSSDKFFKGPPESESLVREFIQNSLDASNNSKTVKVIINEKKLNKRDMKEFLTDLEPHLKACKLQEHNKEQQIRCIVLEDFNTKGLEGKNKDNFFKADNITNKTEGGGSHGIGKAVFSATSKIKTFFGYSIYGNNESIFQGRSVLKSHKIGDKHYRSYGDLKIKPIEKYTKIINMLFKRQNTEKGLSVVIPYCDVEIEDIKQSCLEQFYMPIIDNKLELEIENEKINKNTLDLDDNLKIRLALEYKTSNKKNKLYSIKEKNWKDLSFPKLSKDFIDQKNPLFLSFEIEMLTKQGVRETGKVTLLIQKEEKADTLQTIDFWRDNLLITEAITRGKKQKGYSVILRLSDDHLSQLLRNLEDPGHTKWQTGSIKPEIKEKYSNIPKLVTFIKKLPLEFIRQIKHQPLKQDSHFFSDYFPDISSSGAKQTKEGKSTSYKDSTQNKIPEEPQFQNFIYKAHKKGDGFTLKLKNQIHVPPDKLIVDVAYGTNRGDAFKNYDKRDFMFDENITINLVDSGTNSGERKFCKENSVTYSIINEKFGISFTGFDPDKELKINIKERRI